MKSKHDPSGLSVTSLISEEEEEIGDSINWKLSELKQAC
jgi:hypothetical protein